MLRKSLLVCGMLAWLVYVGVDVLAAIRYPEYHSFTSRAISELMASGAPTERLVDPLFRVHGTTVVGARKFPGRGMPPGALPAK